MRIVSASRLQMLVLQVCFIADQLMELVSGMEYCLDQTFEVKCQQNEIIWVNSALYGRMRLGSCVTRDYGHIGCSSDVTDILAGNCSGRRKCRIVNFETMFAKVNQCPADLKSYLEATSNCIQAEATKCHDDGFAHARLSPVSSSGLISNVISYENKLGGSDCPWVIEALPGQRLNLTIVDFVDSLSAENAKSKGGACQEYATVIDGKSAKRVVMCRGVDGVRSETVYTSRTNRVEVTLHPNFDDVTGPHFVIHYEVIGCAFPDVPIDAHIVVVEEDKEVGQAPVSNIQQIRVQCNSSDDYVTLSCKNGRYSSDAHPIVNCTRAVLPEPPNLLESQNVLPYGISLLLILVVAMCICLITLAVGLIYVNRKNRRFAQKNRPMLVPCISPPSISYAVATSENQSLRKANTLPRSQSRQNFNYSPVSTSRTSVIPRRVPPSMPQWVEADLKRVISVPSPQIVPASQHGSLRLQCTCSMQRPPRLNVDLRNPPDEFHHPPPTFSTFKPGGGGVDVLQSCQFRDDPDDESVFELSTAQMRDLQMRDLQTMDGQTCLLVSNRENAYQLLRDGNFTA